MRAGCESGIEGGGGVEGRRRRLELELGNLGVELVGFQSLAVESRRRGLWMVLEAVAARFRKGD